MSERRKLRGHAAFFAVAVVMFLSACAAPKQYMGIDFASASVSPEIRSLAQRAQSGDKQAQLDLGIAFEEGRGVERNLGRARKLYRKAAATTGGTIWVYQPTVAKGAKGGVVQVNTGQKQRGLAEAAQRLEGITKEKPMSLDVSNSSESGHIGDKNQLICRLIRAVVLDSTSDHGDSFRDILLREYHEGSSSIASFDWKREAASEFFQNSFASEENIAKDYRLFSIFPNGDCAFQEDFKAAILSTFKTIGNRGDTRALSVVDRGDIPEITPMIGDIFDVRSVIYDGYGYSIRINFDRYSDRIIDLFAVIWE